MPAETASSAAASPARPAIATFFPGYFALVMATGIVSLAAHFRGLEAIAAALFAVNIAAYAVLWIITLVRLVRYPKDMTFDLTHHPRGVTFLTKVAGTCVLGTQFAVLTPYLEVAAALWLVGVLLWMVLIYTFFASVTLREPKPPLEEGINGAWLLVTVATESVAVLGTLVSDALGPADVLLFVALCAYLLGAMFYILFIALILYRWMFFSMQAIKVTPPYWINMGALAITTLAGARLLLAADRWALLQQLRPFLAGFTLFFWVTGTWWIPLLSIIGIWRHLIERVPIRYEPQYWSLVFPLGMYTVATHLYASATGLTFLDIVPAVFVWIALAAWVVTFLGLLHTLVRVVKPASKLPED
jgi:tellurite resistance protein TehA-like permease